MKLGEFIKKLQKIEKEHGASAVVRMADGIPIVSPVYCERFIGTVSVIITGRGCIAKTVLVGGQIINS